MQQKSLLGPVIAIILGSYVEWFDFFLAGIAAGSVWPFLYFQGLSPELALAVSIFSFGIIFLTRPIGAIIFGHFGDRIGRLQMIMWTLGIQGVCVLATGLVPVFTGGIFLIILFRALQGIGLGGEFGGGASWLLELASKSKHRGFITSFSYTPVGFASATATALMALIAGLLTKEAFLDWGWRIPFIIGSIVAGLGIVIRYRLSESPLFQNVKEKKEIDRSPIRTVVTQHWRTMIMLALTLMFSFGTLSGIISPFSLNYMITVLKQPSSIALTFIALAGVGQSVGAMFGAFVSDIIGRRKIMLLGAALTGLFLPFYIPLLNTLNVGLMVLAVLLLPILVQLYSGVTAPFFSEHFPTKLRYSGCGLSYQFGGLLGGSIVAFVYPAIIVGTTLSSSWPILVGMTCILAAISFVVLFMMKETKDLTIS